MKRLLFSGCLALVINSASAQQTDSIPCPAIDLQGPYEKYVPAGKDAVFYVNKFSKNYLKSHSVSYTWEVSDGRIIGDSKGTSIYVDTKGLAGKNLLATVKISGLEPYCPSSKTVIIQVRQPEVKVVEKRIGRPSF